MSSFESRDLLLYLGDVELSADRVLRWATGRTRAELFADEMRLDAIVRHLIIIGEAVKQVPPDIRARAPEVPWAQVARFRDILVHHYFGASEAVIWDVVSVRVGELAEHIRALREELEREEAEDEA